MNRKYLLSLMLCLALAIYLRAIQATAPYTMTVLSSNSTFIEHGVWLLTTISYGLGIEFYVKCLFTIIAGLTVFYLARELTKSDRAGVIAVFLFAISSIAVFYGDFGLWSGQSFTPIFAILALLLFLWALRKDNEILLYLSIGLGAFIYFFWTGGIYWVVALVVAAFFVFNDSRKLLPMLLGVSIIAFVLLNVPYHAEGGPSTDGVIEVAFQYFGSIISPTSLGAWFVPVFAIVFLAMSALCYSLPALYEILSFRSRQITQRRAYHGLLAMLVIALPFVAWDPQWLVLTYLPTIVFAGAGLDGLLPLIDGLKRRYINV